MLPLTVKELSNKEKEKGKRTTSKSTHSIKTKTVENLEHKTSSKVYGILSIGNLNEPIPI